MRYLIVLMLVALVYTSCEKNTCHRVIITRNAPCQNWIQKNADIYVVDSLPLRYQQEGMAVCADYHLYEDLGMCACCGGTRANIFR